MGVQRAQDGCHRKRLMVLFRSVGREEREAEMAQLHGSFANALHSSGRCRYT